jgi:hypothetical protein
VSNVLNEQIKQQIIALGRLGWSLRRIQESTGVRRETASGYLREAGIAVRPPGLWGRGLVSPAEEVADPPPATNNPAEADSPFSKPAIAVTTDSGAELAIPARSGEADLGTDADAPVAVHVSPAGVGADPVEAKPAIGVTTDFGVASDEQTATAPTSASACAAHRDAVELGLSRGRNAMAIWQDLVDTRGFTGGYQSVKRSCVNWPAVPPRKPAP